GPVPSPDGGRGHNGGHSLHPPEHPRGPFPVQNGQGHPQHLGPAVITSHPGIVAQATRACQAPGLPPPRDAGGPSFADARRQSSTLIADPAGTQAAQNRDDPMTTGSAPFRSAKITRYTHSCVRIERDSMVLVIDPGI